MKKIISYDELPKSTGQTIYLRMNETDTKLYVALIKNGYRIINNISYSDNSTIYITGRRQDYQFDTDFNKYKKEVNNGILTTLKKDGITEPNTVYFSYKDLVNYKYQIPFVLKNVNQNGGREKFLINTEEDYENLILACTFLINKKIPTESKDKRDLIDYGKYLSSNFEIQEFIKTPSKYNTTVRLLTSSSNDLLYAVLKYKLPDKYEDKTTLLGYLLSEVFPLSSKSIVSNTLSGGKNILIGEKNYVDFESELLKQHNINSEEFSKLISSTQNVHEKYKSELGIICGFDYIYDEEKEKWFLLELHSRPMLGDYSKRQGIKYQTFGDKITAEGRVRATALKLTLNK